jgi:hypothetical protein
MVSNWAMYLVSLKVLMKEVQLEFQKDSLWEVLLAKTTVWKTGFEKVNYLAECWASDWD